MSGLLGNVGPGIAGKAMGEYWKKTRKKEPHGPGFDTIYKGRMTRQQKRDYEARELAKLHADDPQTAFDAFFGKGFIYQTGKQRRRARG